MKKIYCEDCKFYVKYVSWLVPPRVGYRPCIEKCKHPNNIIIESNYETTKEICIKSPKDINKDNDCPWVKKTPWWRFLVDIST
ncbi:MAG: hypothetical protein RBT49_04200 [Bacteroidales bacterium]|jgi:hypothetical protein|nr:hypothetical protein [Bacteroidales bacterium]